MKRKSLFIFALVASLCVPGLAVAYGGGGGGGGGGDSDVGSAMSEAPSLDGVISFGAGVDPQKWVLGAGHGIGLQKHIAVGQASDQDETDKNGNTSAAELFITAMIVELSTASDRRVYVDKKSSDENASRPTSTPGTQKTSVSNTSVSQKIDKKVLELKELYRAGVFSNPVELATYLVLTDDDIFKTKNSRETWALFIVLGYLGVIGNVSN